MIGKEKGKLFTMVFDDFQEHLKKNDIEQVTIEKYIKSITDFSEYLKKEKTSIESFPYGKLIQYTESLVDWNKEETVLPLIRSLYSYSSFIGHYDYIEELIDIIEASSAMDALYKRTAEFYGEKVRDEIFKDVVLPPLGVHPEKKPEITKIVMRRLEEQLGEEKTVDLLRPCLHGRPEAPTLADKEVYLKLNNIDQFLAKKH